MGDAADGALGAVGGLVIMAGAGALFAAAGAATLIDGGHGGALSPGLWAAGGYLSCSGWREVWLTVCR